MAAGELSPTIAEGGDGPASAQFICGFLGCDLQPFNPVLSALPRMLRVRHATVGDDGLGSPDRLCDAGIARSAIGRARRQPAAGRAALCQHVRRYLQTLPSEKVGWLAGLRNPLVMRALTLLHDAPATRWTLDALAAQVGTSRSVLAERFMHFIGQPPMQYLRQLRMQSASRLLGDNDAKVASVANAVGFESEAAFSRAFKKCVGLTPTEWRRRHQE